MPIIPYLYRRKGNILLRKIEQTYSEKTRYARSIKSVGYFLSNVLILVIK